MNPTTTPTPNQLNTLEAARQYVKLGWRVVPIPRGCKGPIMQGWQHLRLAHADLPREVDPDGNVGLILGEPSGWLVDVDLDSEQAREFAREFLPATVVTGREGNPGSHWWYICEGAVTTKFTGDDGMIVEIRSTGAQTVVGPSTHPKGGRYDMLEGEPKRIVWEDLLAAVRELASNCGWVPKPERAKPAPAPSNWIVKPGPATILAGGYGASALAAECSRVAQAMTGTRNDALNTAAFRMGQLIAGGEVDEGEARKGLMDAAHANGMISDDGEAAAVATLESGLAAGKSAPRVREARSLPAQHYAADPEFLLAMDLTGWLSTPTEEPRTERTAPTIPPFPTKLLDVPGLVGEVMRHNLATAPRPMPPLALAGALALQAVLASRWICDAQGNRTNLYVIGLAPTGAGKQHAMTLNASILHLAGADELDAGGEFASDAGMVAAVHKQPGVMFQIDELGNHLQTMRGEWQSPHLFGITTNLLKFFSLANGVFKGKCYADAERNVVIDRPCVVLHGTSTMETFWRGLRTSDLHSGLVGRLCVFMADRVDMNFDRQDLEIPSSIVDAVTNWKMKHRSRSGIGDCTKASVTDEATAIFRELIIEADQAIAAVGDEADGESLATVRARDIEKARRLALVYACSVWDPSSNEGPKVDADAARWACELTRYQTAATLAAAELWVADSQFDARQKDVLRKIERAKGRGVTRSELCRATRSLSVRERTDVVENLIQSGEIVVLEAREGNRGPAAQRLVSGRWAG